MTRLILASAAVALLAGCNKPMSSQDAAGAGAHGRYSGVGIYPAGQMWAQIAAPAATQDPRAAKLSDDEQVIVVVDSKTGELRQCGNLSGYCVSLSPWAKALAGSQNAPFALTKHADQLAQEAEAKAKASTGPTH